MSPERAARISQALDRRQPDLAILMEEIEDPHNIAAVMRSCDAVGIQDIFILAKDLSRYQYFGRQSSASAFRWVTVHLFDNIGDCLSAIRKRGLKLMATHLKAEAVSLYEMDLTEPLILAFGNERKGISNELLQYCDGNFVIPQMGMIHSLNISVACAVSLYEVLRQRDAAGRYEHGPGLDTSLKEKLRADWSRKLRD